MGDRSCSLLLSTLFPFSALGIFWGFSRGLISSHLYTTTSSGELALLFSLPLRPIPLPLQKSAVLSLGLSSRDTGGKCALAALLLAPRASATSAPRRMRAVALRAQRPMKVTPFGRSPWSRNRFPRNFVPPPSGNGHVDTRRPTWLVYWLRRS